MYRRFEIGDCVELVGTGYTCSDAFIVDIKGFWIFRMYAVVYRRSCFRDDLPVSRVDWFFKGSLARSVGSLDERKSRLL